MRLISDISTLRHAITTLRHPVGQPARRIALVPTMGNLHDGHLSLVRQAREQADIVIATVFVNPLQFGEGEDFDQYPRTLEADAAKLDGAGCDILFAPAADDLFPAAASDMTRVVAGSVSQGLCGAKRPGHFDGVVTIISLLFNLVQPDTAIFGEKDYQQLQVIKALVRDLHFPVEVLGAPIVRDHDGLALSSRNGYLSDVERATAPALYRTLVCIKELLEQGLSHEQALEEGIRQLDAQGFTADYLELRDRHTLVPATEDTREGILLVAAYLGTTRLLDNLKVELPVA
ncbi:pantoate--beta-alanine ligase [Zymobacter sp. IVIA_5232.4 C2]|uniref:pantoate--beta-alanine ligase n=1 Tax=Zymobacter sp. IVIA_5232.4 C2 TaxID=3394855 RepID=UPI0039C49403